MGKVKVRTSLTIRDRGRWNVTTTNHAFTIDLRTGLVEERDPNGYIIPVLDDSSLLLERIDWVQLGRTAKVWLVDPQDRSTSIETTGQVVSIVSEPMSRSALRREQLDRDALGDAYTTEAMWEQLGVGSSELRSMVADAQVLEVMGAKGERGYPVFQVGADGRLLPGLGEALCELASGVDDPWTWWIWCTSRPAWAGGRRVWELLRDADTDTVVRAAGRAAWSWRQ